MIAQCLNGPVRAGDVVRVVLPRLCCGGEGKGIGMQYMVSGFNVHDADSFCPECGEYFAATYALMPSGKGADVRRLIRIDPPATPEAVEMEREVVA